MLDIAVMADLYTNSFFKNIFLGIQYSELITCKHSEFTFFYFFKQEIWYVYSCCILGNSIKWTDACLTHGILWRTTGENEVFYQKLFK